MFSHCKMVSLRYPRPLPPGTLTSTRSPVSGSPTLPVVLEVRFSPCSVPIVLQGLRVHDPSGRPFPDGTLSDLDPVFSPVFGLVVNP